MKPLDLLAKTSYSGHSIELSKRGDSVYLLVNRVPIRTTELARIEEVPIVELCRPLVVKRQPRILLEGLGIGISARKADVVLSPRAKILAAEVVPDIRRWFGPLLPALPGNPQPNHFRVFKGSLAKALALNPESYDVIILELDYLIDPFLASSTRLVDYFPAIQSLKQALRSRGQLAIHCEHQDSLLISALEKEGFAVDHRLEAPHERSKARHHITYARLPISGLDEKTTKH